MNEKVMERTTCKNELNYRVITPKGDIPIKNIQPGDLVYNYYTGEPMEVKAIRKVSGEYVSVVYSDGRCINHIKDEPFLDGFEVMEFDFFNYLFMRNESHELLVRPYEFNYGLRTVFNHALTGALYAYGNWDEQNANLPITSMKGYEVYGKGYILEMKKSKDLIDTEACIEFIDPIAQASLNPFVRGKLKFDHFFPKGYKYEMLSREKRPIPKEIMYGSVVDRNEFLTGIFDIDKFSFLPSGEIALYCNNEYVVRQIQTLLWSLGIISTASYSQQRSKLYGYDYILAIRKKGDKVPDFIYNIHNINSIITEQTKKAYEFTPVFELVPKVVKQHERMVTSYNLIFDKPKEVYLLSNFMPKVSL